MNNLKANELILKQVFQPKIGDRRMLGRTPKGILFTPDGGFGIFIRESQFLLDFDKVLDGRAEFNTKELYLDPDTESVREYRRTNEMRVWIGKDEHKHTLIRFVSEDGNADWWGDDRYLKLFPDAVRYMTKCTNAKFPALYIEEHDRKTNITEITGIILPVNMNRL